MARCGSRWSRGFIESRAGLMKVCWLIWLISNQSLFHFTAVLSRGAPAVCESSASLSSLARSFLSFFLPLLTLSMSIVAILLCCAFARHSLGLLPFSAVISAVTVPQLLLLWTRPVILCPLDSVSPAAPSSHSLSFSRAPLHPVIRSRLHTSPWAALLRDCRF